MIKWDKTDFLQILIVFGACKWTVFKDNADLKIFLYVRVQIKIIPWKFHLLNLKNSWVFQQ